MSTFHIGFAYRIDDVRANMIFHHFGHQPVDGPTCSGDQLQHVSTTDFLVERPLDSFDLSADASHTVQQFGFFTNSVTHFRLRGCVSVATNQPVRPTEMTACEAWPRYLGSDNLVDLTMQSKSLFAAFRRWCTLLTGRLACRLNRNARTPCRFRAPTTGVPRSRKHDAVRTSFGAFIGGIGFVATSGVAIGHHSIAMFDRAHPVQVIGTVRDYRFASPHAFITLEVT